MIEKLQRKFVAICMTMVTAVLAMVFLLVGMAAQRNIESITQEVLHRVINESYSTAFPPGYPSGGSSVTPFPGLNLGGNDVQLPYFTVAVWPRENGYTAYVTGGTYANLEDTEELQTILRECLDQNLREGTIKTYNLRYLRQENGLFEKIAFVDMSMELATLREMMHSYLRIGLAALLLLLGTSILLSRWATHPVEKAWRQQRQFLSDASHELKTPLTVILSNAELLDASSLEERPARWADNIRSEARQMKFLVEEMLTLARADNMTRTTAMEVVSLSELATDCALAFEPVAFEAGKPLEYQIQPDITVLGDREKLRQVVSILLDNAIKYGADGGTIHLSLEKTERQAKLSVENPGEPIPAEKLPHLFERFYRADDSRGEKSGFGLGLSIAASIALEHKALLKAESDQISTRFSCTFPLKR